MKLLRRMLRAAGLAEVRCAACNAPFVPEEKNAPVLCPTCLGQLEPQAPACPSCGLPAAGCGVCGGCLADPPPWERFRCVGPYTGLLRDLILRAKFGSDVAATTALGTLLALRCRDLGRLDALIPVPLHPTRLRERGFNQCVELLRPAARLLGIPLRCDLLERCTAGRTQRGLSRVARLHNLDRAFVASPQVSGLRVLLVDDILTTGATLRQAAAALRRAGAVTDAAAAARTPSP